MKKFIIPLLLIFVLISVCSIPLMAIDATDQETVEKYSCKCFNCNKETGEVAKDIKPVKTGHLAFSLLFLIGLGMKQVQVKANTFTYKNIIYNKGARIDVDELEYARLIGSYPFGLQVPLGVPSSPIIKAPEPTPEPLPQSNIINTEDLRKGGEKNDAPEPKAKSDEELLNDMQFKELKALAKSLKIKIPFGVSKAKLIPLILKNK